MFVPSISRYIHKANKEADDSRFIVPLAGAALGNGWVDAEVQGPATIDYSWWHGLIDKPTRDALHREFEYCMKNFGNDNEVEPPPFHPFDVQDDCGIMWGILEAAVRNSLLASCVFLVVILTLLTWSFLVPCRATQTPMTLRHGIPMSIRSLLLQKPSTMTLKSRQP